MITKLFLSCVIGACGWIWLEHYRTTEVIESQTSLMQKYEKSGVRAVLDKDRFEHLAGHLPKLAALLVSMDPAASRNALKRWFALILIGWVHFCFLSRWPDKFFGAIPRTQVFLCPFGLFFFFLALKLLHLVMGYFSIETAIYFNILVQAFLWLALISTIGASLLSIPASLTLFVLSIGKVAARILMITGCRLWTLGEKMLGAPQGGIRLKISECITQKLSHLTGDGYRRGPALPGPIVRRMEINGVKYDF